MAHNFDPRDAGSGERGHGDPGSGASSVGAPGIAGGIIQIIEATKNKRPEFNPLAVGRRGRRTQEMIATTERKISESVRLGNPVSDSDLKRLSKLKQRLERIDTRFKRQIKRQPGAFARAGIAAGTTLEQFIAQLSGSSRGQQIIAGFQSPLFNPAHLLTTGGTATMPFVVTPSVSDTGSSGGGGFGGFGDILGSVIRAGGQIGSALLGRNQPTVQPFPGLQQASLVPLGSIGKAIGPLLRGGSTLGGIAAGAVGGELADSLQNIFSGGASTADDTAAFTDPVPGSCRPKAHLKVNPCTGKGTWFTPRGRPLVYSGDLAACKRVDRVSKRLNKSMPLRKHGHTVRSRKR